MSERHEFYNANPKHLYFGELVDVESGEFIRPATAHEALTAIRARRKPRPCRNPACSKVTVQKPEEMSVVDWRLAIALKLRFDRAMTRGDYDPA